MAWQFTIYVVPMVLAMLLSLVLGAHTLIHIRRESRDPVLVAFLGITIGLVLWTGFSTLKLVSTSEEMKLLFYRLLYLGVSPLAPLALLFSLAYTDRRQWIRPSLTALLFVVPLCAMALHVANPAGLAWESTRTITTDGYLTDNLTVMRVETAIGYHLSVTLYSTVVSFLAIGVIVYEAIRLGRSYVPQAILLLLAITAPLLVTVLSALEIPPFGADNVNLIPWSALVISGAFWTAVIRYRLLDLPPIAYTTVIEDSPDGVLVADTERIVVQANKRGEEILDGFGARVGESLEMALPAVNLRANGETVIETVTEDASSRSFSVRPKRLERGGRHVGWVVVLRDITERRQREQQLEAQKEQLDQFASIVSHDLRNPLNVAQLYVDTERRQGREDPETLKKAANALDRIERIVDETLTLARQGERVKEVERADLERLACEAWQQVETKEATLTVSDTIALSCDPERLQHLFENLYRNSVQHGGGAVTVRIGVMDSGFTVEDDGLGVPPDERDQILEPGYTTAEEGTGFGLSIVSQIADAHGWDVVVTGNETGGARFEFTGVSLHQDGEKLPSSA